MKEEYHEKIGYYCGHFVVDGDFLSGLCARTGIWRRGRRIWSRDLVGTGYCWNTNGGPGNLSSEQRVKLDKLRYAFLGDTADLRNKIWSKISEMDKLLNSANPDEKQIRDLQKEISALKAEMGDKRISYELEAKKIAPEAIFKGIWKGTRKGILPESGWSRGGGRKRLWPRKLLVLIADFEDRHPRQSGGLHDIHFNLFFMAATYSCHRSR